MPRTKAPKEAKDASSVIVLTEAQRRMVAELSPELAGRLMLAELGQKKITLSREELKAVNEGAKKLMRFAGTRLRLKTLRHLISLTELAVYELEGRKRPR